MVRSGRFCGLLLVHGHQASEQRVLNAIVKVIKHLQSSLVVWAGLILLTCFAFSPVALADDSLADTNEVPSQPTGVLVYPGNQRQSYPITLLKKALQAAGTPYHLVPSETDYGQKRSLIDLARGQGIDVSWSMTSKTREDMLLPVRIPVFKGLIGWRIPLVRTSDLKRFARIEDVTALSRLRVGQMHDWPDTGILKAQNFNVFSSSTYEGLFRMLAKGRIDYFPRSIVEIWREMDSHPDLGLSIEPSIVLRYPTAFYYFVSKERPELHDLIHKGLSSLKASGEFDALFMEHHADFIERAQLHQRKIITIDNAQLPDLNPLDQPELWFQVPVSSAQ